MCLIVWWCFQAPAPGQTPAPQLLHCASVLDTVVKVVPGLQRAVFLMAKVRFQSGVVVFGFLHFSLSSISAYPRNQQLWYPPGGTFHSGLFPPKGDTEAAQNGLQHLLDQNPAQADAHLLMAQIHLTLGNFKLSSQSLELCLSHNFEVRSYAFESAFLNSRLNARLFLFRSDTRAPAVSPDQSSDSEEDGSASGVHPDAADGHESVWREEDGLLDQKTKQEDGAELGRLRLSVSGAGWSSVAQRRAGRWTSVCVWLVLRTGLLKRFDEIISSTRRLKWCKTPSMSSRARRRS